MRIQFDPDAVADLEQLQTSDPDAADDILVALEEAEHDPALFDKLTQHGDNDLSSFTVNVKRWIEGSRGHRNQLWRLRVLHSPAHRYRVVYGFHVQYRQIVVLAIVPRKDFHYGLDSDLARRIAAAWRRY